MVIIEDDVKAYVDEYYEDFMRKHMGLEGPFKVVSEYPLKNGQLVDKVIFGTDNKILALIECKGEVGTNEFVRGFGQTYQGICHIKRNVSSDFDENAKSLLLMPLESTKKIPLEHFDLNSINLVFVDLKNKTTVEYKEGDYIYNKEEEWITINPYYFRDCSLEGIYFYLKLILKSTGSKNRITLSAMEKLVRKTRDDNKIDFFGDIRNNHIVPSVFGFYDPGKKILTQRGYEFTKKSFQEFCKDIVLKELGEYSKTLIISLLTIMKQINPDDKGFYKITTKEIGEEITKLYEGKKVTYLFDPDGGYRNLLTLVRMCETIGAIERDGRDRIKLNYIPLEGMPFLMEKYVNVPSEKLKQWFALFDLPL